jgi:hypothetical protein
MSKPFSYGRLNSGRLSIDVEVVVILAVVVSRLAISSFRKFDDTTVTSVMKVRTKLNMQLNDHTSLKALTFS